MNASVHGPVSPRSHHAAPAILASNIFYLKFESTLHTILRVVDVERTNVEVALSNFGDLGKVTTTRPKVTLQALGAIGTKELEDLASILKEVRCEQRGSRMDPYKLDNRYSTRWLIEGCGLNERSLSFKQRSEFLKCEHLVELDRFRSALELDICSFAFLLQPDLTDVLNEWNGLELRN